MHTTTRTPDPFNRYALNLLNRFGRVFELRLGAEESVRAAPALFVCVDQRDGFEVGWTPCKCGAERLEPTCCTDCPLRAVASRARA